MGNSIVVRAHHVARFRRWCQGEGNPYLVWTGRGVRTFLTDRWPALCCTGAFVITTRDDLFAGNPEALDLPDESLAAALTQITNDLLAERAGSCG